MTAQRLIRWSGLLTILLGALLFLLGLLPSLLLPEDEPVLEWVLDRDWIILSVPAFVLSTLTPLVLTGLYAKQVDRAGATGLVGFLMAFLGALLFAGLQFDQTFVWPSLARHAPSFIDFSGPMFTDRTFSVAHFWIGPVNTVGLLIFGVATVRARVFARWSAVLFTIGMPLSVGVLLPPLILRALGAVLAAPALIGMGYRLWSDAEGY